MSTTFRSNAVLRQVPNGVKFRLYASIFSILGFFFFILGATIGSILAFHMDFKSITFKPDQKTTGRIIDKESTNASENNRHIYKYSYEFSKEGRRYEGASYTSDEVDPYNSVEVAYENARPQTSCIVGMRMAPFSAWLGLLLLIFPLVGIVLFYIGLKKGSKNTSLVTNGILTKGKVVSRESTNITINKRRQYRILFEFKTANSNTIEAKCLTTFPEKVEDEAEEYLVYDPREPEKAVLLDTLPDVAKKFLLIS